MALTAPSEAESPEKAYESSNGPGRTVWHKSAPQGVRKAFRLGKDAKGWDAWTRHLAKRSRPVGLSKLLPGKRPALAWVLPDGVELRETAALLAQLTPLGSNRRPAGSSPQEALLGWLAEAAGTAPDAGYALEALAWCHALPGLAAVLPPDLWWDLLDHLLGAVSEAGQIELDHHPLVHQMLAGELALTLAYQFPEITSCRKLAQPARRALSAGLVDLLDGGGLPQGRHWDLLRLLLACWTRCRAIGGELPKGCWSEAAQTQYEWLVRMALRSTRHDGTHVFSQGPAGAWSEELFEAAIGFGGNGEDKDIAALVLPGGKRADARAIGKLALPEAAVHSEWAGTSVLCPGWSPSDPRLVAVWSGESVRLELECHRDLVWSGVWELEVRREGEPARPTSAWEVLCWVSDDDGDYLELGIDLGAGLRVQRHLFLAREDRFLLLADAILGSHPGRLEYRGRLPISEGVSFQPAEETREGFLAGRKRAAAVLPLALPEWRLQAGAGSLAATERGLELCQSAEGPAMFAPLLFDLKPRRMTRPLTWRRLTVAQNLKTQPDHVAVGYRVMVGREQWLIYRSLAAKANRTLLGHNLSTELLVARFDRSGEVEPLIEIE